MSFTHKWSAVAAGLGLFCLTLSSTAQPSSCTKQSPAHRVALVELYTSEGCSSCPPADRWLGELSRRFSAEQLVALSLHVDYWDYIGWQDPFAHPRFTERQRWLAGLARSTTVYTPEVFTGMKELRGWHRPAAFAERVDAINRMPAGADVTLQMEPAGGAAVNLQARFVLKKGAKAEAIVVVYENQLVSEVRAGENRGTKLQHERVVRFWSPPIPLNQTTEQGVWRHTLSLPAAWQRDQLGIAAFVQDPQAGEILQAVSMPGCIGQRAAARSNG